MSNNSLNKPLIAITMGDPGGIGPEIILKTLNDNVFIDICNLLIIGHLPTIEFYNNLLGFNMKINILNAPNVNDYKNNMINIIEIGNDIKDLPEIGKISMMGGVLSFKSIEKAIELAMEKNIDAIVTAPINKECLNKAGYNYSGHTEIFAKLTGCKNYCMLLASDRLKIAHVTTHIALKTVFDKISVNRIVDVIVLLNEFLIKIGLNYPLIGVAGINPHAGENGLFGNEESTFIIPAIEKAKEKGINIDGPIPPDSLFPLAAGGRYHGCVAMYHDQGHIPFKMLDFKWNENTKKMEGMEGVNITLGLPIIRTSVDHGTAYEIAGKGIANHNALKKAIHYAIKLSTN